MIWNNWYLAFIIPMCLWLVVVYGMVGYLLYHDHVSNGHNRFAGLPISKDWQYGVLCLFWPLLWLLFKLLVMTAALIDYFREWKMD